MGVRETDIRDYPKEVTRLIKALALAALVLMVGIGGGIGLDDGLDKDVGGSFYLDDAGVRTVRQRASLDAAALTWASYPMRPGRVEAVAGTDILAASSSSVGVLQAQYRYISSSVVGAIICAEGTPWPCDWALATVQCESGGNPTAWATEIVEVFIDGAWVWVQYYFHGWFQIASTSPDPGPLADPVYNTERAVWKYINEGPAHAWPGCP